jgi:serine/threonine protein phosphatase PrpC
MASDERRIIEGLPCLAFHRNKLNKSALLYDRNDDAASPTWSLCAGWERPTPERDGIGNGRVKGSGNISDSKIMRIPDFAADDDDDDDATSMASRSTWVVSHASTTQMIKSPGAYLRLQSISKPTPHPLPEFLKEPSPSHKVSMERVLHSMASLSRTGRTQGQKKKSNQDSSFAFRQFVEPHQAIAAIMDGHGTSGAAVSRFVRRTLPEEIAKGLAIRGEVAVDSVMRTAFLTTHESLRTTSEPINARLSGSTAVVSLLQGHKITTAWVGDSRALVVRELSSNCFRAISLTKDHKPVGAERTRIMNNGGRVQRMVDSMGRAVGPARVWLRSSWVPGLAMSRVIGDTVAHSVGVVAEPEVSTHELDEKDRFLVVASDGVFEFLSNHDVARIVGRCETAEGACKILVQEAAARWDADASGVADDITVVVAKFAEAHDPLDIH